MKKWVWLILVPALAFAGSNPWTLSKSPAYLDVHPDKIVFLDDQTEIAQSELAIPGNRFEAFLDGLKRTRDRRYVVLILRPGSADLQRRLREQIRQSNVDIGIEPWEADRAATVEDIHALSAMGDPLPVSTNDLFAAYEEIAGTQPCDVEFSDDALTLLKDNVVVAGADLDVPGNPFEQLVDQTEARAGMSCLHFCRKSGGSELFRKILAIIAARAPKMAWNMGIETSIATVLFLSPVEANAEGKQPVYFECRHNQLFSISPERIDKACSDKLMDIRRRTYCDEAAFRQKLAEAMLEVDGQSLSYSNTFRGTYVLTPLPDARGYSFADPAFAADHLWFTAQMENLDPEKQYVCFFVRSDGIDVFRQARKIASCNYKLESACEWLDDDEPVVIEPRKKTPLP